MGNAQFGIAGCADNRKPKTENREHHMTKIVFLGDSLTWGGYGGNYVSEVENLLPQHTIINAGVGGDTVVNLLRRVEDVIDTHDPDAMFVMVGGNDAVSYSMPLTRGYYRKAKQLEDGQVRPNDFEATYRELLTQIQLRFVQVMIGLPPTEYSRELVAVRRDYNHRAQRVAEAMNVPVLDLDAAFTPAEPIERAPVDLQFIIEIGERGASGWNDFEAERAKWGYTYTFDGMHLMPDAALQMAKHIAPFVENQVG